MTKAFVDQIGHLIGEQVRSILLLGSSAWGGSQVRFRHGIFSSSCPICHLKPNEKFEILLLVYG